MTLTPRSPFRLLNSVVGESKPFTGSCHNGRLDLFYYRDPNLKAGKSFPLWTIM